MNVWDDWEENLDINPEIILAPVNAVKNALTEAILETVMTELQQ